MKIGKTKKLPPGKEIKTQINPNFNGRNNSQSSVMTDQFLIKHFELLCLSGHFIYCLIY